MLNRFWVNVIKKLLTYPRKSELNQFSILATTENVPLRLFSGRYKAAFNVLAEGGDEDEYPLLTPVLNNYKSFFAQRGNSL